MNNGSDSKTTTKLVVGTIIFLLVVIIILLVVLLIQKSYSNEGTPTTKIVTTEDAAGTNTEEMTTEATTEAQLIDLSIEEAKEFESLLNSGEYNGFALIQYNDPSEIEWDQVCYCGAGVDMGALTKEQQSAYLKAADMDEMYTDVTAITASEMEAFVERTTGTKYGDAKKPLTWTYVSDYDFYASMHGDTNYLAVSNVSGQRKGDEYTIRYNLQGFSGSMENHVLTLKKNGDQYLFLSNVIEGVESSTVTMESSGGLAKASFTDDELCEMALNYYQAKNGYRPSNATIDSENGDMVTIWLYDDMGDHTATSAWYEVSRLTAAGTDTIFGTSIDLLGY